MCKFEKIINGIYITGGIILLTMVIIAGINS